MKRLARKLGAYFALLCAVAIPTVAIPNEESIAIQTELSEPLSITLKNGQQFTGNPVDVSENQIQIASTEGAGEIIHTFSIEQIRTISIPGESYKAVAVEWINSGELKDAHELFELLYSQRGPLLPILPASESHFFTYYVELILDSANPARAIAITETLRPQINNPAALRALDDAILESYQSLELYEEATQLAATWIAARKPYGESALGYYVLGTEHIRSEAYEEALDLALRPIVFASPITVDKIDHCYAVAVSSALGLRERTYAATLYQEMQTRGFTWPANDSTLQPFLEEITDYIKDHEEDLPQL